MPPAVFTTTCGSEARGARADLEAIDQSAGTRCRQGPLPDTLPPQSATLATRGPSTGDWRDGTKFDGDRVTHYKEFQRQPMFKGKR